MPDFSLEALEETRKEILEPSDPLMLKRQTERHKKRIERIKGDLGHMSLDEREEAIDLLLAAQARYDGY